MKKINIDKNNLTTDICTQCPRMCHVDRKSQIGFCGANNKIYIAKVMLHHWEEPIISGSEKQKGSGAIFFSHCNLKCVYCQNYEISHSEVGKYYSPNQLANLFKELENQGALNINLVTPTHYSLQILETLKIYKPKIPVIWNTSGYENPAIIQELRGYIDIFLTDFKYFSNEIAKKYSLCDNYFEMCSQSLKTMKTICQKDIIENNLMTKGVIVRHLVLPNNVKDSIKIFDWLKNNFGTDIIISLMSQYTPCGDFKNFPDLCRKLKPIEYKAVLNHIQKLGFNNGFIQEISSANNCYIPDFFTNN